MYIIIGALLLVSSLNYVNWFTAANPLQLAKVARTGFVVITVLTLGFLAFSGKLAGLIIGLLALLPMVGSIQKLWIKNAQASISDENQANNPSHYVNLSNDMDRKRAFEVLGLINSASNEEINEAHRRIIQLIHPDKGGSSYLAAQVNRAKQILIGEL